MAIHNRPSRLRITSNTKSLRVKPTDEVELREIVEQELDRQGPDADLNFIDTSLITDMRGLFYSFRGIKNIKIDEWDVSNVWDMRAMFGKCYELNADLSSWDTSKVINMSHMFLECYKFNSDLSQWDTSSAVNMESMFDSCTIFESDLSEWNTSKVTHMSSMFQKCSKFESDLSAWDVSNVKKNGGMFYMCTKMMGKKHLQPKFNI